MTIASHFSTRIALCVGPWAAALATTCSTAACGGNALIEGGHASIGALSCDPTGAGAAVVDDGGQDACSQPPCTLVGAWQPGGGAIYCATDAACTQVLGACAEGAIRFDASGALLRLTSAGWENACSYSTCGNEVSGAQLSALFTANFTEAPCGPFAVHLELNSVSASRPTDPPVAVCTLKGSASCTAPTSGTPPESGWPNSVDVNYTQCTP